MDNGNEKNGFFKPCQGTGDCGMTDLLGGRRVSKTHNVIKLNAALDDLNSFLGLLRADIGKKQAKNEEKNKIPQEIYEIQRIIMKISAKNAGMDIDICPDIDTIIKKTVELNRKAVPPKEFVVPGSNTEEALAHIARTRTRLCEIHAWEAGEKDCAVFLNRLSDYLFILGIFLRE